MILARGAISAPRTNHIASDTVDGLESNRGIKIANDRSLDLARFIQADKDVVALDVWWLP